MGEGEMTISAVEPGKHVKVDLHFLRPFESTGRVTFAAVSEGEGTKATWAMEGDNSFVSKAMARRGWVVGGGYGKLKSTTFRISESGSSPCTPT